MRIFAWNIIALRDTVCVVKWLFLWNYGALIEQINDLHSFKQRIIYKNFNAGYMCVLIVRVRNCECMLQNVILKHPNVYMSNKFQGGSIK